MAAYNSNVATRHILEGSKYITRKLFQSLSYRISDILEYSETKQDLINKIGSRNVRSLEFVENLHLHDFAIHVDLTMDDEEKAQLEKDIAIEIQNGTLGTEDKIDIMAIKNLKYANEILKIRKKRREQKLQEQKMQEIEAQKQANIQSAQAASQSKLQEQKMKVDGEAGLEGIKHKNAMDKMREEYALKDKHEEVKASFQIPIKQDEKEERMQRELMKEQKKDERVKKD